ncbi:MAG: diaminopimelate dehydrogenase [Oscillospiraceae bacterium]
MMIQIGIAGYGNLARGAVCAIAQNPDMTLSAIFTRRPPESLGLDLPGVAVCSMDALADWRGKLDVLLLCGGSATDLPEQTPLLARDFTVVDSFDNHAKIPGHFARVDTAAQAGGQLALISAGWDPGLFSLNRLYAEAVLPVGETYTFWGKGVSQGHSDAIRRLPGVLDARQYTVPVPSALERVRAGENPTLTPREKHTRQCFVVAEEGADQAAIRQAIVTMPDYFAPYDTTVDFISAQELQRSHAGLPHGGHVLRSGTTGADHRETIEYSLGLDSNPEFTSSVLVAFARAAVRMHRRGLTGCYCPFDVAPADLSPRSREDLLAQLL